MSLLVYRSTPLVNGKSPAPLLYGRTIRSNLPINEDMLKTRVPNSDEFVRQKIFIKDKPKLYFDKNVRELPPLQHGDHVRLRDIRDTAWMTPAVVQKEVAPRSYV